MATVAPVNEVEDAINFFYFYVYEAHPRAHTFKSRLCMFLIRRDEIRSLSFMRPRVASTIGTSYGSQCSLSWARDFRPLETDAA